MARSTLFSCDDQTKSTLFIPTKVCLECENWCALQWLCKFLSLLLRWSCSQQKLHENHKPIRSSMNSCKKYQEKNEQNTRWTQQGFTIRVYKNIRTFLLRWLDKKQQIDVPRNLFKRVLRFSN